jgi:hemerythrin-like domain-containing protein
MVQMMNALLGKGRSVNVLDIIKKEHREAEALLDQVEKLEPGDDKMMALAQKIEAALTTHVQIEEKLFYARIRASVEEDDQRVDIFEAYTEHEVANHLIALLKSGRRRDDALFKAELQVLGESIKHHVQEEESTVFGLAHDLLGNDELEAIGLKWQKARQKMPPTPAGERKATRKKSSSKSPARKASPARKSVAKKTAKKRR